MSHCLYRKHVPFTLFIVLIKHMTDTNLFYVVLPFFFSNDMSTHTVVYLAENKLFVKANSCITICFLLFFLTHLSLASHKRDKLVY